MSNYNSSKQVLLSVIGMAILIIAVVGVAFAFFNYTRVGTANVIRVGKIAFNSNQTDTINLTNVFPIDKANLDTDTTNVDEAVITITGDTTYPDGIEYLITAVDVSNTIGTGNNQKSVPISISVSGTNLGTDDEVYFDNRGGNTSLYHVLAKDVIEENGRLVVGYITSGQTGVNGTVTIKAYFDKDRIGISDTYDGTESEIKGTTNEWADGRTILTTTEWNALQTNGVSFKVKVEANEGVWVEEIRSVNVMNTIPEVITDEKTNIKEVYFNKMGATNMQQAYDAATIKADLTYNNEGKVLAWLEENTLDNTKYNLIIASDGDTYLTTGHTLFVGYNNMSKIEFNNMNTSRVTEMSNMFSDCSSLTSIDLSSFNTDNVTTMLAMFYGCTSLTTINLEGLDTGLVTNMAAFFNGCINLETVNLSGLGGNNLLYVSSMFYNCTSLEEIDMSGFNFGSASMNSLFANLTNLTSINLTNSNTSNVTDMDFLFENCSSIENIDLSNLGGDSIQSMSYYFKGCTSLKIIDMSGFNFGRTYWFGIDSTNGPINVEYVDLSDANMSNVSAINSLFSGATHLTIVDLTGISLNSSIQAYAVFNDCSSLTTIYTSSNVDWSSMLSSNSIMMFTGCTSLVGGNGTTYDANNTNSAYAKVDGGSSNPGYFTVKTS